MKTIGKLCLVIMSLFLISCGGNNAKEKSSSTPKTTTKSTSKPKKSNVPASKMVDLTNKGVGPIKTLDVSTTIDQTKVKHGEEIFNSKCKACHKVDKRFIGPSMAGVTQRRSPEWIMNMILNPNNMVKDDPLAKKLLMEFNGAPMANQNLSKDEARAVFEYFRTL